MSSTPREGDAGWLRYEGDQSADPVAVDAPTPDEQDQQDQQDHPAAATDAAWLRHDLPDPSAPDATHATDATDVPATMVGEADESTPAHVSSATRPLPAVAESAAHRDAAGRAHDDAHDGAQDAHGDGGDDTRDADEEQVGGLAVLGAAIKEFAIVVGMALVLSFIVKTWLLQAFYIPSGSMEDTLVLNDRVIVSKLTPGPIDLKRGDIIVFADPGQWLDETPAAKQGPIATVVTETLTFVGLLPDNAENHLIKRVIGLPGDHVVCCDEGGRITINGTAIREPYLKPGDSASDQDFDITVPSGRVWVMGDHRSNSADSRAHDGPQNNGSQGSVDERLIVGRAVALVWPLDHLTWLSNPTSTFAKVPAPSAGSGTPQRTGGTGGQGQGGSEVGGTDTPTGSG